KRELTQHDTLPILDTTESEIKVDHQRVEAKFVDMIHYEVESSYRHLVGGLGPLGQVALVAYRHRPQSAPTQQLDNVGREFGLAADDQHRSVLAHAFQQCDDLVR